MVFCRYLLIFCLISFFCALISTPAQSKPFNIAGAIERCLNGGCDVIAEINKKFDEGVQSKSKALSEGARIQFELAMDMLFSKHILPTVARIDDLLRDRINQTDSVFAARIDQIDSIGEARIRQVFQRIDASLELAGDQAIRALRAGEVSAENIIIQMESSLVKVLEKASFEVVRIIDRADALVSASTCRVGNLLEKAERVFTRRIPKLFPEWSNKCFQKHNLHLSTNHDDFKPAIMFDILICEVDGRYQIDDDITSISAAYTDLLEVASGKLCDPKLTASGRAFWWKRWLHIERRNRVWVNFL